MKTRVCLKYFVNDCRTNFLHLGTFRLEISKILNFRHTLNFSHISPDYGDKQPTRKLPWSTVRKILHHQRGYRQILQDGAARQNDREVKTQLATIKP